MPELTGEPAWVNTIHLKILDNDPPAKFRPRPQKQRRSAQRAAKWGT